MALRQFLRDSFLPERGVTYTPLSWADYQNIFKFGGNNYAYGLQTTMPDARQEPPDPSFTGYAQTLYRLNPVLFACAMVRLSLFCEARFQFRRRSSGRPGELFGGTSLSILENPWPGATTGDLLARAIQDSDISGNAYFARQGSALRRMRPDWVAIVLGSNMEPDEPGHAFDAEVIGYLYYPGGYSSRDPVVLLPEQVCHFAPIPDPVARFRGMSWVETVIREIMADQSMTAHKLKYFEQGATVNLHVNFDSPLIKTQEQFDAHVASFRRGHEGTANAFKSIFTAHGTTLSAIGSNLQQADFKTIQGASETRIAAAARTPAVLVGISEGLQGSALNTGNYNEARRQFADFVMRPLWRNFAGSMQALVEMPTNAELWYDDRDIPALQADVKDAAEIQSIQAQTIRTLVDGGFEVPTVIDAVVSGDFLRLKHTNLLSVQLQEPGATPPANGNGALPIGEPA